MKRITLCFFLIMIISLTHSNLSLAQSSATPITAIVMQDEATLKQSLANNDLKFYLNGLNEEQLTLLKKNASYYEAYFTVQINSIKSENKEETECKVTFLNNDTMSKRVLTRYFKVNTISTVLFNGTSQTADDFFNNYILIQ